MTTTGASLGLGCSHVFQTAGEWLTRIRERRANSEIARESVGP